MQSKHEGPTVVRQVASHPDWAHLPLHSYHSSSATHHGPTHPFFHCRVQLMCRETEFFCYHEGKLATSPLPELLKGWEPQGLRSRRSRSSMPPTPSPSPCYYEGVSL